MRPTSPGTSQAAFRELPAARCLHPNEHSPRQMRASTATRSRAVFWSPCCRVVRLKKEKVQGNQQVPARRDAGQEHAAPRDDPAPIPAKSHGAESLPCPRQSGSFNLKKCLQDIGIETPTVRSQLRAGIFIPNIALWGHTLQEGAGGSGSSRARSAGVPWPGGAWKASTVLPVMNCKARRENQELKRKKKKACKIPNW